MNASRVSELIRHLSDFNAQSRINLSLGFVTPTLSKRDCLTDQHALAKKALEVWAIIKEHGFYVPKEFIAGPWCVAIAKHSAVLQPNGSLQKCFCTVGRKEYNFGTIYEASEEYLRDYRFEQFRRTDQCIEERCAYLPMCGGGCIHDAIVAYNGPDGFDKRFCQKTLLHEMNQGLLSLHYG